MQERFDQFGPIKAKAKGKEKHLKYFCNCNAKLSSVLYC